MTEDDAERQRDGKRQTEGGARQLDLLERLVGEEARMVADETNRVDERVEIGGVGERHTRFHRTSRRRSVTSARSETSARPTASAPAE